MSYQANKKKYIKIMFSFVKDELDGPKFVRKFFKLWKADRDEEWTLIEAEEKPLEERSHKAVNDRTKSDRPNLESKFIDMLAKVFTACDAFNVDPEEGLGTRRGSTALIRRRDAGIVHPGHRVDRGRSDELHHDEDF